jgi:hypothetical protein
MNCRRLPTPLSIAFLVLAARLLTAAAATADATDGTYGRLDGDLDISVGAGVAFAPTGPSIAGLGRAMYLETAGLYLGYSDALGADRTVLRSASFGVGLRPLFLPRWGFDLEKGPATLDLALDALTLDVGAVFGAYLDVAPSTAPGVEIALGTEVPLAAQAAGPWIGVRGALQWRSDELARTTEPSLPSTRVSAAITLSWHAIVNAHIVDARDRLRQCD